VIPEFVIAQAYLSNEQAPPKAALLAQKHLAVLQW
jgi:hypothetical protein